MSPRPAPPARSRPPARRPARQPDRAPAREAGAVVLTRAPEDNRALAARIRALGLPVLEWPALATEALPPVGGARAVRELLAQADWVTFSSRRAVEALARVLGADGLAAALVHCRLAAVGERTAHALAAARVTCEIVGPGPGAEALAPELLGRARPGETVVLACSAAATDSLPGLLEARGVHARRLALHGPAEPPPVRSEPVPVLAVVCASPSAGRTLLSWNPWLVERTFVAIGPTTAAELHALGVRRVEVAAGPNDDDLLATVAALAARARSPGDD